MEVVASQMEIRCVCVCVGGGVGVGWGRVFNTIGKASSLKVILIVTNG